MNVSSSHGKGEHMSHHVSNSKQILKDKRRMNKKKEKEENKNDKNEKKKKKDKESNIIDVDEEDDSDKESNIMDEEDDSDKESNIMDEEDDSDEESNSMDVDEEDNPKLNPKDVEKNIGKQQPLNIPKPIDQQMNTMSGKKTTFLKNKMTKPIQDPSKGFFPRGDISSDDSEVLFPFFSP